MSGLTEETVSASEDLSQDSLGPRCWSNEVDSKLVFNPIRAMTEVALYIRRFGPFDGGIGFSQGGLMLSLAASLLEPDRTVDGELSGCLKMFCLEDTKERIQHPFKCLLCFSAPDAPHLYFQQLWEPRVQSPMLYVIGKWDTMIDEASSRSLAHRFEESYVIVHYGGHFVPKDSKHIHDIASFVTSVLVGDESECASTRS